MNIAVCDDEKYMTELISECIEGYFEEKNSPCVIDRYLSGRQLIECGKDYDAVFLDIIMPGTDGMKTAEILRENDFKGNLIFTTVLEDNVFDAFAVAAFDYIVKPVDRERLYRTLSRLEKDERRRKTSLIIKRENENRIIKKDDIIFCEVIDHLVYIHVSGGETVLCGEKMDTLAERLGDGFFRCHRSYIINMKHLISYGRGTAELSEGVKVPVSRLRSSDLNKAVIRFVRW